MIGKRFGKLVVIKQEPSEVKISENNKNIRRMWLCKCDCGEFIIKPSNKLKEGYARECLKCKIKYCPNHPEKRTRSDGLCGTCYHKEFIKNNKEDQRNKQNEWRKNNPGKNAKYLETRKNKIKNDKETWLKVRNTDLKKKYGIEQQDYLIISEYQNNVCYLCSGLPKRDYLSVDHDHKTGKVRGLLCERCNLIMGTIDKNPNMIKNISSYLKGNFEWTLEIWNKQKLKGKLNGN